MKRLFLSLLLLPCLGWAQDSTLKITTVQYLEPSVWRIVFLGPGLVNESRLGSKWTLVSEARLTGASSFEETRIGPNQVQRTFAYSLNPQLIVGGRYYYNFTRRLERGKSIRYNSGNYLSLRARGVLPPIIKRDSPDLRIDATGIGAEAVWGFQRTYRRNFYLNLSVGLGYFRRNAIIGAGDFTIGYTFPNRR